MMGIRGGWGGNTNLWRERLVEMMKPRRRRKKKVPIAISQACFRKERRQVCAENWLKH
jgi:hypothetical protein